MSFQNCILREDKTEKSVNLEMSSEYLFSLFSDGDTSNSSTGILWSNIYITMGISPESLGSDLCCEDADRDGKTIIVQITELDLGASFTKKVSKTYFNEGIEKALQTLTTNGDCCAMLVSSPVDDLDLDLDFCDDHLSQHPDTRETGDSNVLGTP